MLCAAVLFWSAAFLTAPATPAAEQKQAADKLPDLPDEVLAVLLPKGEGRETVKRVCATECHTAERVAASAGTRDYWETIVEDMTLQGAVFSDEEQEEIVGYLAAQYPPKLDVNRLSAELLVSRLKFSTEEAAAIVAYRSANGPFTSIEALLKVPGVAAEKINAVSRQLAFGVR
jgi:DNA uptake protein ComE-like DNA-binding protein